MTDVVNSWILSVRFFGIEIVRDATVEIYSAITLEGDQDTSVDEFSRSRDHLALELKLP